MTVKFIHIKVELHILNMDLETDDVRISGYIMSIPYDDQYIGNCLRQGAEWDGWMRYDLPHLVKPGTDILDIGGNIGWNALMFSEYGPVHTFEPLFYKIISKNIVQNSTRHPITLHPYGLSNRNQICEFWIPVREGNLCNYGGTTMTPSTRHEKALLQAPVERLDDVYSGTPSLMKIDVEGHELEVLEGAEKTIREHLPNLYVEIFDFENGPVPLFLKEIGYTRILPRPEHNYLFLSPRIDS